MKKIPTVFRRDPEDMSRVLDEWHPDCLWVRDGEGVATRKYDGTCVRLEHVDGKVRGWARREVKRGRHQPPGFVAVETDWVTGKTVGWEPIERSSFHKFYLEAIEPAIQFGALVGKLPPEGTYELVGPKINGNPEGAELHRLESHANAERIDWAGPLTFESLREMALWLADEGVEGVVWHHPDGRMAKLKGRDFRRG